MSIPMTLSDAVIPHAFKSCPAPQPKSRTRKITPGWERIVRAFTFGTKQSRSHSSGLYLYDEFLACCNQFVIFETRR
jgi:hypothetical protein